MCFKEFGSWLYILFASISSPLCIYSQFIICLVKKILILSVIYVGFTSQVSEFPTDITAVLDSLFYYQKLQFCGVCCVSIACIFRHSLIDVLQPFSRIALDLLSLAPLLYLSCANMLPVFPDISLEIKKNNNTY